METLIVKALAKIKPKDPLRVVNQAARRNRKCSDSSRSSLGQALTS
jgi:hypothetical protein